VLIARNRPGATPNAKPRAAIKPAAAAGLRMPRGSAVIARADTK
jgi:hypothetical protein